MMANNNIVCVIYIDRASMVMPLSVFFLLVGRTLDTAEGKPGSLRQTAEEVNNMLPWSLNIAIRP